MNYLATKAFNIIELLIAWILLPNPSQEITVSDSRRKNDFTDLKLKDGTRTLINSSGDKICQNELRF
jgi:hypothetical protein